MGESSRNWLVAFLGIGFGLFLMIHCWRAGLREFRSGVAEGALADYSRNRSPIGFWIVVSLTFAASVMGGLFILYGIALLIAVAWQ